MFLKISLSLPAISNALVGRAQALEVPNQHYVHQRPISGEMPANIELVVFGLGCFWGAERLFWQIPGVFSTAAGYAGGITLNPTYEEVCSGQTGHTEIVAVYYDPEQISLAQLFQVFWEAHNPTEGMRQGNDIGTQYRSAIYVAEPEHLAQALESAKRYQFALHAAGKGDITTEIAALGKFYLAEEYHQQYLAKNPNGYCSLRGTGIRCPA